MGFFSHIVSFPELLLWIVMACGALLVIGASVLLVIGANRIAITQHRDERRQWILTVELLAGFCLTMIATFRGGIIYLPLTILLIMLSRAALKWVLEFFYPL